LTPFELTRPLTRRSAKSVSRILEAAARMFGTEGYQGASMLDVAKAAGVSKGLLHYHFQSKEHLLIEAQRATFRQVHRRFQDRFRRGDRDLETALEGLDALWEAVREMRSWAPFMVQNMSIASRGGGLRRHVDAFYEEAMALLEGGIREAFAPDIERLTLPPARLARLIRVALNGLVIELAYARSPEDLAAIDESYADMRELFSRVVFTQEPS